MLLKCILSEGHEIKEAEIPSSEHERFAEIFKFSI